MDALLLEYYSYKTAVAGPSVVYKLEDMSYGPTGVFTVDESRWDLDLRQA
jgi:hypothetical protein